MYISQVSGERLQDHWSSGYIIGRAAASLARIAGSVGATLATVSLYLMLCNVMLSSYIKLCYIKGGTAGSLAKITGSVWASQLLCHYTSCYVMLCYLLTPCYVILKAELQGHWPRSQALWELH